MLQETCVSTFYGQRNNAHTYQAVHLQLFNEKYIVDLINDVFIFRRSHAIHKRELGYQSAPDSPRRQPAAWERKG